MFYIIIAMNNFFQIVDNLCDTGSLFFRKNYYIFIWTTHFGMTLVNKVQEGV